VANLLKYRISWIELKDICEVQSDMPDRILVFHRWLFLLQLSTNFMYEELSKSHIRVNCMEIEEFYFQGLLLVTETELVHALLPVHLRETIVVDSQLSLHTLDIYSFRFLFSPPLFSSLTSSLNIMLYNS
jgi:hypothetical protein